MKKRNIVFLMTSALLAVPAVAQDEFEQGEPLKLEQPAQKGIAIVEGAVIDDATENPIPGARLQVIGAPYSAMTDDNGAFSLKVPVDAKGRAMSEISVSGPDRNRMIVPLRNRRKLTIRLMEKGYATKSDREVYTPLGMKEESHLMSAVGIYERDNSISVKGSPEAALQGVVSGLQTQFRSGTDWSGSNLYLRGINSLHGTNNPLLVLDGLMKEYKVMRNIAIHL